MDINHYNKCVDNFADGLYRFVLKLTNGDEDDAKDIVQESYARLWEKKNLIDFNKAKSYLFKTAYHCFIDYYRYNKRKYGSPDDSILFQKKETFFCLKEIIEEGLKRLPAIQKTVLLLRDYEGYSYEEIGEITNLSPSQVKVYIFRARMKLKEYIVKLENVL